MEKEITYIAHGHNSVYAGNIKIAESYLGTNGYEARVLQGCPRMEVNEKIIRDCPDFARANNMDLNKVPFLFSVPKRNSPKKKLK